VAHEHVRVQRGQLGQQVPEQHALVEGGAQHGAPVEAAARRRVLRRHERLKACGGVLWCVCVCGGGGAGWAGGGGCAACVWQAGRGRRAAWGQACSCPPAACPRALTCGPGPALQLAHDAEVAQRIWARPHGARRGRVWAHGCKTVGPHSGAGRQRTARAAAAAAAAAAAVVVVLSATAPPPPPPPLPTPPPRHRHTQPPSWHTHTRTHTHTHKHTHTHTSAQTHTRARAQHALTGQVHHAGGQNLLPLAARVRVQPQAERCDRQRRRGRAREVRAGRCGGDALGVGQLQLDLAPAHLGVWAHGRGS
jgi:hypothetical protein